MIAPDPWTGSAGLGEVAPPEWAGIASAESAGGWLRTRIRPVLSRGTADRSEDLRDPERTARMWPTAAVLLIDAQDRVVTAARGDDQVGLVFRLGAEFGLTPPPDAVLLGAVDGVDHWALPTAEPVTTEERTDSWGRTGGGLRQWGAMLNDTDAGLLTAAVAVTTWHRMAPFCPRCGEPNRPTTAGWSRTCDNGHIEFPRTDPAVIVIVHDGDRAVLARQPSWPRHRYSVLAGFTEAGESLEATVVREVGEEIGVQVTDVSYLGSQPWPFPRSLMVGFAARCAPGAALTPRVGEIEAARWVTRAEVRALLDDPDSRPDLLLPSGISIASSLIDAWARG